jgi:hypothetical protein
MSLIKKHTMTETKLVANRRNQKLSHAPVTAAARKRIHSAHLRQGFHPKAEETALRALGEDPANFQRLLEGLWKEYDPSGASQEGLVIRLARATWLMNRADRTQEGNALRQAQAANIGRDDRLHVQMMRLKITAETLRLLARSVAHQHYVTTPGDLEMMKRLHDEGELQKMGEIALALFYQLQAPGTGADGLDPQEVAHRVANKIRAIFGVSTDNLKADSRSAGESRQVRPQDSDGVQRTPEIGDAGSTEEDVAPDGTCPDPIGSPANLKRGDVAPDFSPAHADPSASSGQARKVHATKDTPNPYPKITPAEWAARERPRQLLENILTRQVEICEAQRSDLLTESVKGPSPYKRAAELAPLDRNALLLRKMQESYFREVRRITNLLLRLKRQQLRMEASGNSRVCQDITETKGVTVDNFRPPQNGSH